MKDLNEREIETGMYFKSMEASWEAVARVPVRK